MEAMSELEAAREELAARGGFEAVAPTIAVADLAVMYALRGRRAEAARMVEGLEERYDAYMAGSTLATPMIHTGDLPSADELAAELERFLASRPGDDDKRGA